MQSDCHWLSDQTSRQAVNPSAGCHHLQLRHCCYSYWTFLLVLLFISGECSLKMLSEGMSEWVSGVWCIDTGACAGSGLHTGDVRSVSQWSWHLGPYQGTCTVYVTGNRNYTEQCQYKALIHANSAWLPLCWRLICINVNWVVNRCSLWHIQSTYMYWLSCSLVSLTSCLFTSSRVSWFWVYALLCLIWWHVPPAPAD